VLADGFDGVHLDLEPVPSGNSGYLTLLSQVHAVTRSAHRVLSVSVPQVEPLPALHLLSGTHWWSAGYLHQVAEQVDEVAVMTYDTGVPAAGLYSGYVRRETQVALSAVPASVTLLIGAPAYNSSSIGHFNSAETVAAAVRGVRLAISPDPPRRAVGIALYVDFTATAQDWNEYLTGWVRP
jgi:spore germination protein YaaH